jgi:5-methylcytosine-specific restriction endonuclease McrA
LQSILITPSNKPMPSINTNGLKLPWVKPAAKSNKSWGWNTNFYRTKRWRNLRQFFLSNNPLCVECEGRGLLVTATVVDHIIPRRERPDLELDESNLQGLCDACHNAKSGREGRKGRGGKNHEKRPSTNRCG